MICKHIEPILAMWIVASTPGTSQGCTRTHCTPSSVVSRHRIGRRQLSLVVGRHWWPVIFIGGRWSSSVVGSRWSSSVVGGLRQWSVTCIRCLLSVVISGQSSSVISRHQSSVNVISQHCRSSFVVGLRCWSLLSVFAVSCQLSSSTIFGH